MAPLQDRLFILDDDALVSSTLKGMAEAIGYTADYFLDADTFLEQVVQQQPAYLILDLQMPQVDGVEVLRRLAELQSTAAIIISSGLGEKVLNAAKLAADESGLKVIGILPKPFRIKALRELLAQHRNNSEMLTTKVANAKELSEETLREALAERRLVVHYQPQIDCQNGTVTGFEALVRIRDHDHSLIMPVRFIEVAERSGLIDILTEQVFEQAIEWFAANLGETDYTLALNTSPSIFADAQFPLRLAEQCIRHQLAPRRIKLEVTETSTAENPSQALEIMTQLRVKGFALAIDDFGVGYSSLAQLVRHPFSELKIDKNFIIPVSHSEEARKIADALIALAKALKLKTTAEGVEDAQSLQMLAQAGCDHAQGYFISHPLASEQVLEWLQTYTPLPHESGL